MGKDLKSGLKQLKTLEKVKNLLAIMDLVMIKILNNFRVNVNLKTAVVL